MKKYFILGLLLISTILSGCSDQGTQTGSKEDVPLEVPTEEIEVVVPDLPQPEPEGPQVSVEAEATPTDAPIFVDGNRANIRAYSINGSSYVNLRDMAYILNGSRAQFEVGWNNEVKEISLTSNQSYTVTGRELAASGTGRTTAWSIISPVLLDGKKTVLAGYTIGDDSYFSLRDMGEALDFSVGWFDTLRYIVVNTQKSHDEAPLTLEDEYQFIIDSKPRYDAGMEGLWDAVDGLVFADIIDHELLLISAEKLTGEFPGHKIGIEVYSDVQGHAESTSTTTFNWISGEKSIELFKSAGKSYIRVYSHDGGRTAPFNYDYYGLDSTGLSEADHLGMMEYWSDDADSYTMDYYSGEHWETELTEAQFAAEIGKYTDEKAVLSFSDGFSVKPTLTINTSGRLPAPLGLKLVVNGDEMDLDLFVIDSHVMAPMRPSLEKMGIAVYGDEMPDSAFATTKKDTLYVGFEGRYSWMTFNDIPHYSEPSDSYLWGQNAADSQISDGTVYISIRAIAEMFGAQANWDSTARTLFINCIIPEVERSTKADVDTMVAFTLSESDAIRIAEQQGYKAVSMDYVGARKGYSKGKAFWAFYVESLEYSYMEEGEGEAESYAKVYNDGTIEIEMVI